ncbi:MAG: hypothetical protein MK135_15660 [Polyangiaceae bacterium]|nr:hypothetical protein [Polyangiaceae bacterium]
MKRTPSERLRKYLELAPRAPVMDRSAVAKAMKLAGVSSEIWLEFHELVGGLKDELSGGNATWGLMFEKPDWLPKRDLEIDEDPSGTFVACVDAHPGANCWLSLSGELTIGTLEFRHYLTKFERDAFIEELSLKESTPARLLDDERERELIKLEGLRVEEASDAASSLYLSPTAFYIDDPDGLWRWER